jgi:CS domain
MVDYRKFDNIEYDSEEEIPDIKQMTSKTNIGEGQTMQPVRTMTKKGSEGRYKFEHDGRTIYEWEQSLEEVNIYINPPAGVTRSMFDIKISHNHLRIGLKGAPPFIDEDTGGAVKVDESTWTFVDGVLNINLQKMIKAEAWDLALRGPAGVELDPVTKEEVKKKLLLERFQEEVLLPEIVTCQIVRMIYIQCLIRA